MVSQIVVKIPALPHSSYPILINFGLLENPAIWLPTNINVSKLVIITDTTVKKIYGDSLLRILKKQGHKIFLFSFPAGEKSKNHKIKQYIEEQMLRQHCGRDTLILALGGGVVGDLAGYIAATYMRGIAYIQIPTTLLAMLDSSIGGKTGIDMPQGKNLIGTYWQPKAVVADMYCLRTLSKKQIINGLIEALKMFLTNDKNKFIYAKKNLKNILNGDDKILKKIIYHAAKIKADIVSQDEKECNQRMILNFGHTIGHALEQISHYKMLHGFAVAYGILVESKIAQLLNLLDNENYFVIQSLLSQIGIMGKDLKKFDINKIIQVTKLDKKVKTDKVHYVLLSSLGEVYTDHKNVVHSVTDTIVKEAFLQLTTK
jgi:3-dehydroquinate synthase